MHTRPLQRLNRVGLALRAAWLMCGLALALLIVLEIAYRGQGAVRRTLAGDAAHEPIDVYFGDSWFREYRAELREVNAGVHWAPYVHWRRAPFHGRYITIDSAGHRRTVQAPARGPRVRRVFVFGGSTMWGAFQRDSFTIPSTLAADLAEHGAGDLELTNYGETGYVFTQELLELLLALRRGLRPDVVVFYDGINDVYAATQSGAGGVPQNEANRDADFRRGRTLAAGASDGPALTVLALEAAYRSRLIQRLSRATPSAAQRAAAPTPDSLAAEVVATYVATADLIEALSHAYRFRALYFWQPTLHTTGKRLTAFEEILKQRTEASAFEQRARRVHRSAADRIVPAMQARVPGRFFDLTALFAGDTATVYLDEFGHTTELANEAIVAAMREPLVAALRSAPR